MGVSCKFSHHPILWCSYGCLLLLFLNMESEFPWQPFPVGKLPQVMARLRNDVVHGKTGLHPMAQPQNGMLSRLKSDFTPWELHPIRITSCYLGGHGHGALVEFEPLRKVQHSLVISVLQLYLHCLLHVWWYLHCWLLMNISILNLYFLGKFAWWLVQIRKIFFIISP